MNLVTIFGGPRKKGNTAMVLGWVEAAARGNGHDVVRFNLNELAFRGCQACFACAASADAPGCVLQDDARSVFDAMVAADAIVYASPLYMWGVAGPLKAFLDRSTCLVKDFMGPNYKSLVGGKPATLLVTCMGPLEQNADLVGPQFTRFASYAKYELVAPWIIPGCGEPDALPEDAKQKAADLAVKLLGG